MRPVDAAPADLEAVRRILREHAPGLEARAFGSRVSWTARETSDLDLALMTDEPLDAARMAVLRSAFTDSRLPFRVDVVDWAGVSDGFRKVIESEYVTLVGKGDQRSGEGRTTMTLGRFAPLAYGKGLKSDVRNPSGHVPVFGSNGQVGWHDKALTDGPTVIIGRKGTVGSVHYSPEPCWPIDTTFFISDDDTGLMRFKYYALSTLGLATMNTDSAVPGLNRDDFHAREIQTPPIPEQRAIARVLGALDDKIEANRRMSAALEGLAQAVFKDWFVDFGPVRAKAAGRGRYLPDALWSLFPDRLVDSEAGEIPEGWVVSTIGKEVDVVGGSTPSTKNSSFWNGSVNWVTPKDLSTLKSPILLQTSRKITDEGLARIGSGLLPRGTVLLSSRAPIGYLAISDIPVAINQGFIAMICRGRISPAYIYLWTAMNLHSILEYANGSTFQEISKGNFRPLSIVVPPDDLRTIFDAHTEPLFKRIVGNERESRALAGLRDALLPRLVSGEIRLDMQRSRKGEIR